MTNAPTVVVWGTGTPRREFLYVDDFGDACVFVLKNYSGPQFINIGCGSDITIKELAERVRRIVGFPGGIVWDKSKPEGTPRKWMDSSRLFAMGWKPQIDLETGIRLAYEDFLNRFSSSSSATGAGDQIRMPRLESPGRSPAAGR